MINARKTSCSPKENMVIGRRGVFRFTLCTAGDPDNGLSISSTVNSSILDKEGRLVELVIGYLKQCINILETFIATHGTDLGAF